MHILLFHQFKFYKFSTQNALSQERQQEEREEKSEATKKCTFRRREKKSHVKTRKFLMELKQRQSNFQSSCVEQEREFFVFGRKK